MCCPRCSLDHLIDLQGQLLLLAMKLMPGGSLREALQQAGPQAHWQWSARCAGACSWPCSPPALMFCRHSVTHAQVLSWLGISSFRLNGHVCRGRQVALDVAEALDYLHTDRNVMHSDVRSR